MAQACAYLCCHRLNEHGDFGEFVEIRASLAHLVIYIFYVGLYFGFIHLSILCLWFYYLIL